MIRKGVAARPRAGVMPIRPLLQGGSFSPEDVTSLVAAFEDTLSALGLVNRKDPAVLIVARRILDLARDGERNPALRDRAVQSFSNHAPG
jgi:hypothetical protein